MEPYLRQPVFATSRANYAPAIQPQAAPWIASPLDIHEDPRIIAFTAEVIAQGITTSTWFAKRIAMATDHRLHAWATRHEADGSLAGIAPVVIAGAVGWEANPGSLWASLTRAGILDTFGTSTGWASTGGRRGARMSAITPPARLQVTTPTPVVGPSQRGKRLDLDPDDSMERRRWQNATASANTRRPRRTPGGVSELGRSSLTPDLLPPSLLEGERERISLRHAQTREGAERHPARAMHTAWSHPAVITWLEVCGIPQPREVQAIAIAAKIGENSASRALWGDVCGYAMRIRHAERPQSRWYRLDVQAFCRWCKGTKNGPKTAIIRWSEGRKRMQTSSTIALHPNRIVYSTMGALELAIAPRQVEAVEAPLWPRSRNFVRIRTGGNVHDLIARLKGQEVRDAISAALP